ncbi:MULTISPECIES: hypothetical protein [unclassified Nocardia]|jgi:hypothetical protein|uniref:hypothetical protein n=1 Tax=unclassified Nocardia TaxID=2637762 RepID=UPI0027E38727|nr:hypothetical protein [Nocardia sp. MH4]
MRLLKSRPPAILGSIIAAGALIAAGSGSAAAAPHTGEVFLTFVRHAESAGNTSGLIDTSVPGPGLTRATSPPRSSGCRATAATSGPWSSPTAAPS